MENHEFEIFVRRCRDNLLHTARAYVGNPAEAEDIVQDTLLKLFAMRHTLNRYRSLDALASTIVKHQAIDLLRHRERHPSTAIDKISLSSDEQPNERIDELLTALSKLPPKQQLILRMKHIEGMECEDIANLVQMSIDAVYQNLSRARRAILKQFKTEQNERA